MQGDRSGAGLAEVALKRNLDLIREILLWVEAHLPAQGQQLEMSIPGASENETTYHLMLLVSDGYVHGIDVTDLDSFCKTYIPQHLTDKGHDYLDTVRDPEIWRKTKQGASRAGGFTLDLLGDLAKGLVKTQIEKHTGVKL